MDIKQILLDEGFSFLKRYGQNFVTDTNLINAIVRDAGLTHEDTVVEVGSGAGTLTECLAKNSKHVFSFEIDSRLEPILNKTLEGLDNVTLTFSDILSVPLSSLHNMIGSTPYKVVANLPYYITTPVLFYFLDDANLSSITVMVQKEVAKRLTAQKGTAEYGAITAQINLLGKAKLTRIVPRQLFTPQPNVDSAIVRIDIDRFQGDYDFALTKKVIASAFEMRRKMLVNNLVKTFSIPRETAIQVLTDCKINPNIRGEQLGSEEFVRISNALRTNQEKNK